MQVIWSTYVAWLLLCVVACYCVIFSVLLVFVVSLLFVWLGGIVVLVLCPTVWCQGCYLICLLSSMLLLLLTFCLVVDLIKGSTIFDGKYTLSSRFKVYYILIY